MQHEHTVAISRDGVPLVTFKLTDKIRSDAKDLITELQRRGYSTGIVSGDRTHRTAEVARTLGIPASKTIGDASALEKPQIIQRDSQHLCAAMVGNGLNDSIAMAESSVGIAVANAVSSANVSAEICLLEEDLTLITRGLDIAQNCIRRVRWAFMFAAIYNAIGLSLAMTGYMSPVVAAILMPLSSMTVTAIAVSWGSGLHTVTLKEQPA